MKNSKKNLSRGARRNENTRKSQKPTHNKKHEYKDPTHAAQKFKPAALYGFHAVHHAYLNKARDINALYLTDQAEAGFQEIIKKARKIGLDRPTATLITKPEMDNLCGRDAVHQGVALACSPLPEMFLSDILIKTAQKSESLILMLDQVTDPHNIGAIIRSATAFGADAIIMQRRNAPDLTGAAGAIIAKTACGGVEHLPVIYETNLSRALESLKEEHYFAYGLDETGERTVSQIKSGNTKTPEKNVLVLGAEGPGLRRLVKEHCDELIKLPTHGEISSLNVSNAAAVALYALTT